MKALQRMCSTDAQCHGSGVASNGSIAYICGGVTGFEDSKQKLNLADVWVFSSRTCSWGQVRMTVSLATARFHSNFLTLFANC